jgi:hypothetical protein
MRSFVILIPRQISLTYKMEVDEMEGHVARMGKKRNTSRLLVGKPEEKRPLGRLKKTYVAE